MKIISWNIGNFIWAKYFKQSGHYAFDKDDLPDILNLIKPENADVIFLQEVRHSHDADLILKSLPEFSYSTIVRDADTEHNSLFLSKYPILEIHHTNSNDYIIEDITFFPIHFNAFSPQTRFDQAKLLIPDLPSTKGVILGDTNFWIVLNYFLSKHDKITYNSIVKDHIDLLKDYGHTNRAFLALDKFFVTKDLKFSDIKLTKHKISYIDHYMISANVIV